MTWLQRLYETYESCVGREPEGGEKLMPICHMTQRAHVEVVLSGRGEFRRALVVPPDDAVTLIPVTEASAGRSGSKPTSHPLCDKLQYMAGDFIAYGGAVTSGYASEPAAPHRDFVGGLRDWATSPYTHPKVEAILAYVERGQLIRDLVKEKVLHLDGAGCLLDRWKGERTEAPAVFAAIGQVSQQEILVRWRVEAEIGDPLTATWNDESLVQAWISYYRSQQDKLGFCMITGDQAVLAIQHPKRLRHAADQAKLISSNDTSGYTFRGRFLGANEAASVGFEVTQKAHNALRWLIARQAYRDDSQVFVAWCPGGADVPRPAASTLDLFADEHDGPADTAEAFARRLSRKIAGYRSELGARDDVIVMGLESATPGRLSITYYRTLMGSEFLDRIEKWHRQYAWYQDLGDRNRRFVGAPSPRTVAEAAFGSRLDAKLRRATVERLMPCIVDAVPMPRDLVQAAVRRACHRFAMDDAEWSKALGVACALVSGYYVERNYQMALETGRTTRDYLYGRLLAVADSIESYALRMADENRSTTAERLMQRFADRPFSTWRNIELALPPYKSRLRASAPGFLVARESLLQEIKDAFNVDDFTDDRPLSGEFLLAFDVQRRDLFGRATGPGASASPSAPS
jgi:CRISPR-associated protein Csd1